MPVRTVRMYVPKTVEGKKIIIIKEQYKNEQWKKNYKKDKNQIKDYYFKSTVWINSFNNGVSV